METRGQNSRTPRVVRLNNDYTNDEIRRQSSGQKGPKRRYLGLILVTVILVLTVLAYGLLQSYKGLKSSEVTNQKTIQQSSLTSYQMTSESLMIKNIQNPYYAQKYARAQYHWSKTGEKIFLVPATNQSSTAANTANQGTTLGQ